MGFYPPKISRRFNAPKHSGEATDANAAATGASFVCGAFVRFSLQIELSTKEIKDAKFKTNGCGFAAAAADVLAEKIKGEKLTGLHGLDENELQTQIEAELGRFPESRRHCAEICLDAMHRAFSGLRARQIEEFTGEKALICTCFGVSEETIEKAVAANKLETVEDVIDVCNAGGGCGSCRFLIQEIIDTHQMESGK